MQFQKGISLNEFLSLYGTEDNASTPSTDGAGPTARVPELWPRPRLPVDHTQAPAVLSLQPPDLHYRRHHLRGHQAAPDGVVPGIYWTQDKKGASAMKLHRQLGISYNAACACATN